MTKGLALFFVFYIIVVQPTFIGYLWNSNSCYVLAIFNFGIFLLARVVSTLVSKKCKNEENFEMIEENKRDVLEKNIDNSEEKKDESIEKSDIKIQKESVSIPKIVQPISGHSTVKHKKNSYRKTGQRWVLLITLVLSGVLARPLWEIFDVWSIVISLIVGWMFFIVIGKVADLNGYDRLKSLFANWLYIVLILAGFGYGVNSLYSNGQTIQELIPSDLAERVVKYVKNWFLIEDEGDEITMDNGNVYIFEGTGEVIASDVEINDILMNLTGDVNVDVDEEDIEENVLDVEETTVVDKNQKLTMGDALKLLLSTTTLSTSKKTVFVYVPSSSDLYPYFQTAYEKKMIGKSTEPDKLITCDTYITVKGILEGRYVGSYSDIKSAYWKKAEELGKLNGCKKGEILTRGNL